MLTISITSNHKPAMINGPSIKSLVTGEASPGYGPSESTNSSDSNSPRCDIPGNAEHKGYLNGSHEFIESPHTFLKPSTLERGTRGSAISK